jgi:ATP-dependent Clp protease ATP-binding subunit ClpC
VCHDALGRIGPAQAAIGLATNARKWVFEVVVEFSRTRIIGCNFILPEHNSLGVFDLDDPTTSRILKRLVVIFYYILCYFPSCLVNGI